ncbi:AzlD domain-containing protein [Actinomadura sp. NPDC047616]|uniref:AzlD domain-containing protein n=1 Tax=Actinomadura sp. NPDC047616 TaxID=3155914 RepID=UPI00340E722B
MTAAALLLAAGTFAFRLVGPLLRSRLVFPAAAEKVMQYAAVVLLTALVATTTLTEEGGWAGIARPAGVLTAGVLAWCKVPFLADVLAAATVTAVLRLLGIP